MKHLIKILIVLAITMLISCEPADNSPLFPRGEGIFLLNEGNFNAGNGSVSFYSTETKQVYSGLFSAVNGRALGDVPTFMAVDGNRGFIVVNNSGTIEAVDLRTMESLGTVTGLSSPRQIVIDGDRGYVSSLTEDEITIIDLGTIEKSGKMEIGLQSEAMVITGGRLFSAHWAGGNSVVVTDLGTGEVVRSVTVGLEPESMVLDKNGRLWVLCTGGWMGEEIPRIVAINTVTYEKEAEFFFRTVDDNPSSLTVNASGDTLFYIDEGVRKMPVTAAGLPSDVYIPGGNRLFYKLMVGPDGTIYVTDAIDYQQKGDILVFNRKGELLDTEQAGIIPGFMVPVAD
jgi:DNA-binding beta-propeller fold protein YncE